MFKEDAVTDGARSNFRHRKMIFPRDYGKLARQFSRQSEKQIIVRDDNRSRPVRKARDLAALFKGNDKSMNAALAPKAQDVFHLVERRRDTPFGNVSSNEIEQRLLDTGHGEAHADSLRRKVGISGKSARADGPGVGFTALAVSVGVAKPKLDFFNVAAARGNSRSRIPLQRGHSVSSPWSIPGDGHAMQIMAAPEVREVAANV